MVSILSSYISLQYSCHLLAQNCYGIYCTVFNYMQSTWIDMLPIESRNKREKCGEGQVQFINYLIHCKVNLRLSLWH